MEIVNTTAVSINSVNGTANFTMLDDGNMTMQNLSHSAAPETTALHPGLAYSVVTLACLFLLFGLFGNGMTLAVTLRSETRFKPHNILIMSLAVADTLSLLTNTFNIDAFGEISLVDMRELKSTTEFTCKLFHTTYGTSRFASTLMIMLICIERFIMVWIPLRSRHFLTPRVTVLAVSACIAVILVIAAIPLALFNGNKNGVCYFGFDVDGDGESETVESTPLIQIIPIMFIVLPTMIILSLTPLTLAKLCHQKAKKRGLTSQQESTGPDRTSVLLTAVVVVYLTLTALPAILFAVTSEGGTNAGGIAQMCVTVLLQANYSTNFILYTWFNTEFRQNMYNMLGLSCC